MHEDAGRGGASAVPIRAATAEDAAACAAVYAPWVEGTAVTFETEPPTAAAFADRIAAAQQRHAWLVAERDGDVLGYAYGSTFRPRPAYDRTCETTVYLRPGEQGGGVGRALMTALLARLRERGMHRALAVITPSNPPSTALHESLGYRRVALLERVGWKLGAWHDVAWYQLDLVPGDAPPAPLR